MKTTLRAIGMMLVAVVVSLAMTACGDDDDDKGFGPIDPDHPAVTGDHDPELIGTWTWKGAGEDWSEENTYTFNKNGTFTYTEKWWEADEGRGTYTDKGYWSTSGSYVTIYITSSSDKEDIGESDRMSYYIVEDELYLDGDFYTRK